MAEKIYSTSLTETYGDDAEGLGAIRFEGARIYKWVMLNMPEGSSSVGRIVWYTVDPADQLTPSSLHVSGFHIDVLNEVIAGIVVPATVADTAYFWVQIGGISESSFALDGPPSDGDMLTSAYTISTFPRFEVMSDTSKQCAAIAIDASAKKVLLTCPF